MNLAKFWKLIDKTRELADGDPEKQSELLKIQLLELPADQIIQFQEIFDDLKDKAYIAGLWDAAFIIMYYCSDSGFHEFREWLVGRGKDAYENAIKNPETLVNVLEIGEPIFPTLLGIALEAYEEVTGNEMPISRRPPAKLIGKATEINEEEEDQSEVLKNFPELTAKFWKWWKKDKIYFEVVEMLRDILIPLGFSQREMDVLGVTMFQRGNFVVEIMLDYHEPDYSLFLANEIDDRGIPKRELVSKFYAREYNEGKKATLQILVTQWLKNFKLVI